MNDFDYDSLQKKRIARGVMHKKGGSRSRKCGLPSDYLTKKQLEERNGPVMSYAMNLPMDWETFKSMPTDLQQTYLDSLNSRFTVGSATISKELFGMSTANLRAYCDRQGIRKPEGSRLSAANRKLWENWLNPAVPVTLDPSEEPTPVEEPIAEEVQETPSENGSEVQETPTSFSPGGVGDWHLWNLLYRSRYEQEDKKTEPLGLDYLSAKFTGEFDPARFMQWITKLPMPEGDVCINVEVRTR